MTVARRVVGFRLRTSLWATLLQQSGVCSHFKKSMGLTACQQTRKRAEHELCSVRVTGAAVGAAAAARSLWHARVVTRVTRRVQLIGA